MDRTPEMTPVSPIVQRDKVPLWVFALAALVIHFWLFMAAGAMHFLFGDRDPSPPADEPFVVEIVTEPPDQAAPETTYLHTRSESTTKPLETPFESDKDSLAASLREPNPEAHLPLPSVEGEDLPTIALDDKKFVEGEITPDEGAMTNSPLAMANPAPTLTEPQPENRPPQPEQRPNLGETIDATQEPLEESEELVEEKTDPAAEVTMATPPSSPSTPTQGEDLESDLEKFRHEQRVAALEGGEARRANEASAAAVRTAKGIYQKQINALIEKNWRRYMSDTWSYQYADNLRYLSLGTIQMRLMIRRDGKIDRVNIVRSNANASLQEITLRAVSDTVLPPVPEELYSELVRDRLVMSYTFTIY